MYLYIYKRELYVLYRSYAFREKKVISFAAANGTRIYVRLSGFFVYSARRDRAGLRRGVGPPFYYAITLFLLRARAHSIHSDPVREGCIDPGMVENGWARL